MATVVDRVAGGGGASAPLSLNAAVDATSINGLNLATTQTATAGNQKFSPALHFQGSGWKTNATAAAQSCDWLIETEPVESGAEPFNYLVFKQSINGAAYTNVMNIGKDEIYLTGAVNLHDGSGTKLACFFGNGVISCNRTAGGIYFSAGNTNVQDTGLSSPSAGVVAVGNGTVNDFSGTLKLTTLFKVPLTVATLPAGPTRGWCCLVSDASSPTFLATVAGGGTVVTPVFYDGAAWKVG